MYRAHFVKVNSNDNWNGLTRSINKQKYSNKQKLPYDKLVEISICKDEYFNITENIYDSNPCYTAYAHQSISINGIWQCVILNCLELKKNIIIYTGGRTFPLYVSIEQHVVV